LKKRIRCIIILLGICIGPVMVSIIYATVKVLGMRNLYSVFLPWVTPVIYLSSAMITGIIFIILLKSLTAKFFALYQSMDRRLSTLPSSVILPGGLGLITGLLISFLLTGLIKQIPIPWLSGVVTVLAYFVCCYLCISIAVKRKSEMHWPSFLKLYQKEKNKTDCIATSKVLDTSVIIDGRIFDLCKTGFIEGTIVIPEFVLHELRYIADSSDDMKRIKGRRGLDMLNKMQREIELPVKIVHTEYGEEVEVDSKLLRLAKDIGGKILTTDYNLNKVAFVLNIPVLNINELANAIKTALLPGEDIMVKIVKEGKESGQGLAFLDDGTMIVVEDAETSIGDNLCVQVRSVMQTTAGKMIFTKIKDK